MPFALAARQVARAVFPWAALRFAVDAASRLPDTFDDLDHRLAARIRWIGSTAGESPDQQVPTFSPPFFADGIYQAMVQNRIKRYEAIWRESSRESPQENQGIPAGFTVQLLGHLDPQQRNTVANQRDLYQWAYEQARKDCDQRLFWDWSI